MRVNDLISGALLVLFAAAMIAYTATFPPFPGQRYGPSLFPRLLGVGMILCGILLILRGRRQIAGGAPLGEIDPAYRSAKAAMGVVMIIGSVAFYIAASNLLGFVVTAFLIVALLLWWFGAGVVRSLVIALIAVLAVDWFFGWLFRVPLPLGILPNGPANILMNVLRGR